MAKRSQRHPQHCENDQPGCIGGLINILDFRQGRFARKLLSDLRHGSRQAVGAGYSSRLNLLTGFDETCEDIDDSNKSKILKVVGSKTSVKKLMEEEMSSEQHPEQKLSNVAVEQRQYDSKNRSQLGKNLKQTNKSCNGVFDTQGQDLKASASLEYRQPHDPNSEEQSSDKIDLAAVVELHSEICQSQERYPNHEKTDSCGVQKSICCVKHNQLDELNLQLIQKHSNLQEKLSEATEAFLNQMLIEARQHTRDEAIHQSKQFMDALEILNTNKELFQKLLQDPNSLLVKHIQDLRDAQAEIEQTKLLTEANLSEEKISNSRQCEELICHKQFEKQSKHTFFRRKIKSQNRNPSKGSDNHQDLSRIVILKPGPDGMQNSETETSPSSSSRSHYGLRSEGESMGITSHFSLGEIRRKLKLVMGESRTERHLIPEGASLDRIPYKHRDSEDGGKEISGKIVGRDSPSKKYFHIERITKPSINFKRRGKIDKSKDCEPNIGQEDAPSGVDGHKNLNMTDIEYSKQKESNIYIEAKKHLADMVSNGNEDAGLSKRQMSRTLGRILSMPEYNLSPISSPGRDREHSFVTAQVRFSHCDNMVSENMWQLKQEKSSSNLSPLRPNIGTPPSTIDNKPDDKLQVSDANSDILKELLPNIEIQESTCSAKEGQNQEEGDVKVVEMTDIECSQENNLFNVPSEANRSTPIHTANHSTYTTNHSTDTTKICEEEGTSECLKLDSPEENQPSSSSLGPLSPSSVLIQKVEDLEGTSNKPDQPSPVSVLEPFIMGDEISPASSISQEVEPPMQPSRTLLGEYDSSDLVLTTSDPEIYLSCTENKKATFEYVRIVLQASGLSWDEFLGRWHSIDQLLDPSLFDEVEVLSSQICVDRKLLFDCINEVLVEVYEPYFGCSPWVSFAKPNIRPVPIGKNVIREVCEGIDWHLFPQLPSHALEQIIGKDMEKAGKWMDLRLDVEIIGTEMGDIILEELMENTIYELCT